MLKAIIRLQNREHGATAVEYGIMVAAIAAVIIGIVFFIGEEIETAFQTVLDELRRTPAAD